MTLRSVLLSVATTALFGAMTISCSDPVPPTKQGAFAVQLTNTNGCGLAESGIKEGTVSATSHTPVADSDATTITCSVKPSAGGFDFSASINHTSQNLIFSVSGTLPAGGSEMTGAVSFASEATAHLLFSSSACTITVEPTVSSNLGVASGRIWAAITCPVIKEPSSGKTCALSNLPGSPNVGGFFVFENCDE